MSAGSGSAYNPAVRWRDLADDPDLRPAAWGADLGRAVRFLTRLPVPAEPTAPPFASLARALRLFPLVGAGLGAAAGLVLVAAADIGLPPLAAALLAIGLLVVVTGGLHEDGLADAADGFGAGRDPERTIAIMRDSRIGAFGTLALILIIGLKASALAALPPWTAMLALAAAGAGSRAAIAAAAWLLRPARPEGLGAAMGRPDDPVVAVALGLGTLAAILLLGPTAGIVALAAGGLAATAMGWLAQRRIGGYTGDVLGAIQQLTETSMILAAVAAP